MDVIREMCPYWSEEKRKRNDRHCECTGPMICYPVGGVAEKMYKDSRPESQEPQLTPRQNIW